MRHVDYFVEYDDGWMIRLNGKHFGPCRDQQHAIDVAVSAAKKARERGCSPQVLVQDLSNKFQLEWPAPSDSTSSQRRTA